MGGNICFCQKKSGFYAAAPHGVIHVTSYGVKTSYESVIKKIKTLTFKSIPDTRLALS